MEKTKNEGSLSQTKNNNQIKIHKNNLYNCAENRVDERLISKHGRWSSDKARNFYIKDSVSQQLGI